MDDAVIVSGARTPIGTFGGVFSELPATKLGAIAIDGAIRRAGLRKEEVEEVLIGNVISAGLGENPARVSSIQAGVPVTVPAMTVNKVCGSGLKTVVLASQAIRLGDMSIAVAGGMENMSMAPYLLPKAHYGYRLGHGELLDSVLQDGLMCAIENCHMGVTAENVARRWEIRREEADEFAYRSHMKAVQAQTDGTFAHEIVAVEVPQRRGQPRLVDRDEHPRPDSSLERLAQLPTIFVREKGTVTAGNASGINDGAAAVVVMAAKEAQRRGLQPMAVIRGYASSGVEPAIMGIGPVEAVRKALQRVGLRLEDIDLIELNEAFAVQALAVGKELDWDWSRVNVHGGAVALGHPIGCSGTRILVTLLYEMQRRRAKYGMATLCMGGGMGLALVVENPGA
ncbi:MAG: acetyl-CoA C-acetyltransferase [Chloroflexi bacterium]|nr:acetyl-CoA C-acetyltransferase [Chloroflexota bacterium]